MSDQKKTTEAKPDDAVVIETATLEKDAVHKSKKSPGRWAFFVLAFIIGSATSIFALNYYQQTYAQKSNPIAIISTTKSPHKTPSIKTIQEVSKPIDRHALEPSIPAPISSKEGEALMQAISTLQGNIQGLQHELQTLRQQQRNVSHSQALLESMQLHARLTWIMKSNSHLPQIKLAWQEISLLPSLTPAQRTQAEAMLKLAQQGQNNVHQWQQEIDHLIIRFKPSEYTNIASTIITNDSNPWFAWLIQQFSLKRSQSSQQIALQTLKNTLLQIKQGMNLEQWPAGTVWTALRAQVQLRLIEQFHSNQGESKQAQNLQLPENFNAIQADINTLRQAAQSWLEES